MLLFTTWLLVALLASLLILTFYYGCSSRWREYDAGRVFMYLLLSVDSLIIYSLFGRATANQAEFRLTVFAVLLFGLIAAVWRIIYTIAKARRTHREMRAREKEDAR